MKQIFTILGLSLLSLSSLFAQNLPLDKGNMRDGESVEYCRQHTIHLENMKDPAYAKQYQLDQLQLAQEEIALKNNPALRGTIYRIPVVFHVLHNGGVENISREQIEDCIRIWNRDWRRRNADADLVHPDFIGMPYDTEVEFVLATKDPVGNVFGGITRTISPESFSGNGTKQVAAIVAGNDVYQGQWPGDKYLNVFVCGDIGGAAGYTSNPSNFGGNAMKNGIFVLHDYVGSIGTSTVNTSRTLTHETGHWFNLSHTWGGTNNPGVSCGSDNVDDTPITRGVTTCNLNENFCGPRANVENYMDYSYCSKMFTHGQVDRIRAAVVSSVGGRNKVWTQENLDATGVSDGTIVCQARFSTVRPAVCTGNTVAFKDESFNNVMTWSWSFPGGTPATSTLRNPVITYNTPGNYAVSLTVTDSNGTTTDSENKPSFITVFGPGEGLPFFEGFEGLTNFTGSSRWAVNNFGIGSAWTVIDTCSHLGAKSAMLKNFGQAAGSVDELISDPIDLTSLNATDGMTLSFRYAYSKKATANDDYLKLQISNTCGDNWDDKRQLHGTSLSTNVATTSWKPQAADWVTIHITNITSAYWSDHFRFKFRFESDGGNNIYLDDINLYSGAPSESVVVGISENEQFSDATLFPNPADEEVNVRFNITSGQTVKVKITDLSGNIMQQRTVQANEGTNLVVLSTEALASGMYLIQLNEESASQTLRFIVK